MPNLVLKQIFARLVSFSPFFAKPVTKAIKNGMDERYLNKSLNEQLVMFAEFSNIKAYLAKIENLPSYKQGLEKGDFDSQEFI